MNLEEVSQDDESTILVRKNAGDFSEEFRNSDVLLQESFDTTMSRIESMMEECSTPEKGNNDSDVD